VFLFLLLNLFMPYKRVEILSEPSDLQILWRYLPLAKFMDLLQNKKLFFSSISKFDDPREGLPSEKNFHPDRIMVFRDASSDDPNQSLHSASLKEIFGNQVNNFIKNNKQGIINLKSTFFVNCWQMNESEDASQWEIYGGGNPDSVAIVTSFKSLRDSLIDPLDICGSKILYYNPDQDVTPDGNAFYFAISKRIAFSSDREFRLIHWKPELINSTIPPSGISIAVDLEKAIKCIVISPKAPKWVVDVIEKFVISCGLRIPISKSSLLYSSE
jgi:hypothetical protein